MAESWELSAVVEAIVAQPPVADPYSHEWGEDPPDIDEHVEDLEACVTSTLVERIVVHLPDEHLQIPLEEAVPKRDDSKPDAGEREVER